MSENFEQVDATLAQINQKIAEFQKAIVSTQTAFPVRENLASQAKLLVEISTPLLNRFPTKPGSGKAAAWKEITSFGTNPTGVFYAEAGTPSSRTTVYADRSETYKQLGLDGSISGLAIAAGANFQDQLQAEKNNTLIHFKQLEEDAIINADGTGYAFSGLLTQIATGNGSYVGSTSGTVPSAVRTDLDALLKASFDKGANITALVVRSTEAKIISAAITGDTTSPMRLVIPDAKGIVGGFFVNGYLNPFSGQVVELITSMKLTQGTAIGLAERLPAPIAGQGGQGVYLDVLLDYALSDVANTADAYSFRVQRYYVLPMPGRKFCGKIISYS